LEEGNALMRLIAKLMTVCFALSLGMAAPEDNPEPQVSEEPLGSDQVAVYGTVLEYYSKDGAIGVLNVGNITEPLDEDSWDCKKCFNGFEAPVKSSMPVVHRLDASLNLGQRFLFVDPDTHEKKVEENDPQTLVRRAIDEQEQVTDKQVEDAVKKAFETGLFALTEIRFDKQRRHALVAYSFVCGQLCGNGALLILKKSKGRWKVSKVCGSWVS